MNIQEFDYSVDLLQAILWEYNDAHTIQSLANQKQEWYNDNQTQFWEDWFDNVFNLITANKFGLVVWSIILNLPLFLGPTPFPPGTPIFGFGQYHKNFTRGVFGTNGNSTNNLTIAEKRLLLRLRCFQLISRAAIPEINQFLKYIFGTEGPTYVLDGLDMTIVLVFDWTAGSRLVENIRRYDLIPRGAGVKLRIRPNPGYQFGFGRFHKNFNRGTFFREF